MGEGNVIVVPRVGQDAAGRYPECPRERNVSDVFTYFYP